MKNRLTLAGFLALLSFTAIAAPPPEVSVSSTTSTIETGARIVHTGDVCQAQFIALVEPEKLGIKLVTAPITHTKTVTQACDKLETAGFIFHNADKLGFTDKAKKLTIDDFVVAAASVK